MLSEGVICRSSMARLVAPGGVADAGLRCAEVANLSEMDADWVAGFPEHARSGGRMTWSGLRVMLWFIWPRRYLEL